MLIYVGMKKTSFYNKPILIFVLSTGLVLLAIGTVLGLQSSPTADPHWIKHPPTIRVGSNTPWAKVAIQTKYTENGELAIRVNGQGTILISITDSLAFEWEAKSLFHFKPLLGDTLLDVAKMSYNMDTLEFKNKGIAPFLTRRCSCLNGECGEDCSTDIDTITYASNHIAIDNPNARCNCERVGAYEQSFLIEEAGELIIRFCSDKVAYSNEGITRVRIPIICPFSYNVLFSDEKPERIDDPYEVASAGNYDVQLNNEKFFYPNMRIGFTFQEVELAGNPNLKKETVQPTASINYPTIVWIEDDVLTPVVTYRDINAGRKATRQLLFSGICIGIGATLVSSPLAGLLTWRKKENKFPENDAL